MTGNGQTAAIESDRAIVRNRSITTIRPSVIVNEAAIPSQTHHIHVLAKHLLHRRNQMVMVAQEDHLGLF
jgi:hypothetical protein